MRTGSLDAFAAAARGLKLGSGSRSVAGIHTPVKAMIGQADPSPATPAGAAAAGQQDYNMTACNLAWENLLGARLVKTGRVTCGKGTGNGAKQ